MEVGYLPFKIPISCTNRFDKIIISTALFEQPKLVKGCMYGSQNVIGSIDFRKNMEI